jgi:NAD+ diphosphatase
MIQDIYPSRYYNEYRPEAASAASSPVLCFDADKVFLKEDSDGSLSIPQASDIEGSLTYAFAIDGTEYFLLREVPQDTSDLKAFNIRKLRRSGKLIGTEMFAVFTAYHLAVWYRNTKFCGRCNAHLEHHKTMRAMVCPSCGLEVFPRLNPAVIVGVRNEGKLLVTKYNRPDADFYALVAGFVEIGETLEDACRREVMEEAGLEIKNIRYYKSQPWGIAGDILCGFFCELAGSDEIRMDTGELKVAQWVTPEETVLQPDDFSLTCEMMRMFKEGKV